METGEPKSDEQKLEELQTLWREATNRGIDAFDPEVTEFYKQLQDKYPYDVLIKTKLWHAIIGGTQDDSYTELDLPNGEIENFIRNKVPTITPTEIDLDKEGK